MVIITGKPKYVLWVLLIIGMLSLLTGTDLTAKDLQAIATPNPPRPIPLTLDWEICNVGAIHNYITNSTSQQSTGDNEWTIIIGDDTAEDPSMLWTYPDMYSSNNHYLYFASLRIGHHGKMVHLSTDTSPGIDTYGPPTSFSDFDTHFYISDQANAVPPEDRINVAVHQWTYAWAESTIDDFIIYDYWIVNLNQYVLDSFYVAVHADCDISMAEGGTGQQAYARDDFPNYYRDYQSGEFISYMYDGDNPDVPGDDLGGNKIPRESTGYLGLRLLLCPPIIGSATPSVQQGHSWWDWNWEPEADSEWFALISDGIWQESPSGLHDYRIVTKTGPFEISASDSIRVTFAFGIGEGLEGMRANLENARLMFSPLDANEFNQTPVPKTIKLSQNNPNPFNSQTTISYELPQKCDVAIEFFDILGQKIETIFSGNQPAGFHSAIWDAGEFPSGIYFYRIKAGEFSETRKCLLLK